MKDTGRKILEWYEKNKRRLPWRQTKDPYLIWISEIMLQQTRVDQGLDYYLRFIERFPHIRSLAEADEEEVLKYWQGLGYYSRARNLHFSARYICDELQGEFPETYDTILKLKGVGPYTAAAIASISFNLPYPVIDGNVMRVISRLFAIDNPINSSEGLNMIKQELNKVFLKKYPGDFNQALMEFGALFCTPQNPQCAECFLKNECKAYKQKKVGELPRKIKAKLPQDMFIYYFVILNQKEQTVYLRKRNQHGIWKNLYDFPSYDSDSKITLKQILNSDEFCVLKKINTNISEPEILRHQLSHKNIFAYFFLVRVENKIMLKQEEDFISVRIDKIKEYPVSRLILSYFDQAFKKQLNNCNFKKQAGQI